MKRSRMRLRPVLKHNLLLLTGTFLLIFVIVYTVISIRYHEWFAILKFQFVCFGIALLFGSLYLLFMIGQLFFDLKKKRKFFYKNPLKHLLSEGFVFRFSVLNEWNYASTWCYAKDTQEGLLELDIDRIASEQKNYLQLRFKPYGYLRKNFIGSDAKSLLESLDGEADKNCLVFFMEEAEVKKKSVEELMEWVKKRILH